MLPEDVDVPEPSPKRSNGCGAKVHTSAKPKPNLWLGAQSNGTAAVVSLEQQYVPEHLKFTMDSKTEVCGCTRNPVGCAVWCAMSHVLFSCSPFALSPCVLTIPWLSYTAVVPVILFHLLRYRTSLSLFVFIIVA
jgi:hypothetical protein